MTNPFDRTFFKFLTWFAVILVCSFAVMYAASLYNNSSTASAATSANVSSALPSAVARLK